VSECEEVKRKETEGRQTLMVNLLYRNKLGTRLNKSYSSSLMARMARENSCGLKVGRNLPV
jgi:hypothetical protein